MTISCDMTKDCKRPVTHVGSRGFVYCAEHAATRKQFGYESTRKMTASELRKIHAEETGTLEKVTI